MAVTLNIPTPKQIKAGVPLVYWTQLTNDDEDSYPDCMGRITFFGVGPGVPMQFEQESVLGEGEWTVLELTGVAQDLVGEYGPFPVDAGLDGKSRCRIIVAEGVDTFNAKSEILDENGDAIAETDYVFEILGADSGYPSNPPVMSGQIVPDEMVHLVGWSGQRNLRYNDADFSLETGPTTPSMGDQVGGS